jgi:hypothetical protein
METKSIKPLHIVDRSDDNLFEDHALGINEIVFEVTAIESSWLNTLLTNKYYSTLRLFNTANAGFCETVIQNGKPSDRFQLTKLIQFKNQFQILNIVLIFSMPFVYVSCATI